MCHPIITADLLFKILKPLKIYTKTDSYFSQLYKSLLYLFGLLYTLFYRNYIFVLQCIQRDNTPASFKTFFSNFFLFNKYFVYPE